MGNLGEGVFCIYSFEMIGVRNIQYQQENLTSEKGHKRIC